MKKSAMINYTPITIAEKPKKHFNLILLFIAMITAVIFGTLLFVMLQKRKNETITIPPSPSPEITGPSVQELTPIKETSPSSQIDTSPTPPSSTSSSTLSPTPEGKTCGGIAANTPGLQCPTGYTCKLDGNYPDASGKCVKE